MVGICIRIIDWVQFCGMDIPVLFSFKVSSSPVGWTARFCFHLKLAPVLWYEYPGFAFTLIEYCSLTVVFVLVFVLVLRSSANFPLDKVSRGGRTEVMIPI